MIEWDYEKLGEFKNHFGLSSKEIAEGIGVKATMMFKIISGYVDIEPYIPRINAYCEAIKKVKRAQFESLIKYYDSFK